MNLLLDTHALLWMISDDPRLSQRARRCIVEGAGIHWSVASLWEIGIKLSLNRPDFRLGPGWAHLIPEEMRRNGIRMLAVEPAHCDRITRLPWHHRDPFDRLLVAQAGCENLTLLSCDPRLAAYGVDVIW